MKRVLFTANFLVIILLFLSFLAHAVPNLISYQGVLNDESGNPISSTVEITFKIYDAATGGIALWSETQNVKVSNGLFNVKLGTATPLSSSVFLQDTLYIGLQVGSDPEMTPRQQITSGSYAYKAELVGHKALPIGTIMAWAKNLPGVPALPDGWAECNGQTINDSESPMNGQQLPNLNGENRFLRGASSSGLIGGTSTHNHGGQTGSNSLQDKADSRGANYYARTHKHSISPDEHIPPFYEVVWIMKIK